MGLSQLADQARPESVRHVQAEVLFAIAPARRADGRMAADGRMIRAKP